MTDGWHKDSFCITTIYGPGLVEGWVKGHFGVHGPPPLQGGGWNVTHLGSGLAAAVGLRTVTVAKRYVDEIAPLANWARVTTRTKRLRRTGELKAALRRALRAESSDSEGGQR